MGKRGKSGAVAQLGGKLDSGIEPQFFRRQVLSTLLTGILTPACVQPFYANPNPHSLRNNVAPYCENSRRAERVEAGWAVPTATEIQHCDPAVESPPDPNAPSYAKWPAEGNSFKLYLQTAGPAKSIGNTSPDPYWLPPITHSSEPQAEDVQQE